MLRAFLGECELELANGDWLPVFFRRAWVHVYGDG